MIESLIKIKFNLECIELHGNTLLSGTGITCDDIEKVCLIKTPEGYVYLHDENTKLPILDYALAYESGESYLANLGLVWNETRREKWYYLRAAPNIDTQYVINEGYTDTTIETFSIYDSGVLASKAWSIRRNKDAAEVAVDTYEGFRQKGYGRQVVAAWIEHQIAMYRVAIYAHRTGNVASEALANSLGAILFAEVVSYQ